MSPPRAYERWHNGSDEDPFWVGESVGAGCTVDRVANTGQYVRNGWGTHHLRIHRLGSGWDARKWGDFGDPITSAVYVHTEMIVDSEGLANSEQVAFLNISDTGATNTVIANLALRQDGSGDLVIRWQVREGGDSGGLTAYDSSAITVDENLFIDVLYDLAGERHLFRLNGEQVTAQTGITPYTQTDRILLGAGSGSTQSAYNLRFGRLSAGDDSWWHLKGPNLGAPRIFISSADVSGRYKRGSATYEPALGKTADHLEFTIRQGGNRVAKSENFWDTAGFAMESPWTETGISLLDGVNPSLAHPGVGVQEWEITEDTSTGEHRIQQSVDVVPNAKHLVACDFARNPAFTRNAALRLASAGDGGLVRFDLDDGTVQATTDLGAGTVERSGTEDLGSTWYRCWFVVTMPAAPTSATLSILMTDASHTISYEGDGSEMLASRALVALSPSMQEAVYVKTASDEDLPYIDLPENDDEVEFYIPWEEEDGAEYIELPSSADFGEAIFKGRITHVATDEELDSGVIWQTIQCRGRSAEMMFQRYTQTVAAKAAEQQMKDVIDDNLTGDGFTATGNDTMPDVAAHDYQRELVGDIVTDIARRGGTVWDPDNDKNVEMWQPGDRYLLVELSRGSPLIPNEQGVHWAFDGTDIRNAVRVNGPDGAFDDVTDSTSINEYGRRDDEDLDYPDIYDTDDRQAIGQATIDAKKDPVSRGDNIVTWWHRASPGERSFYTDPVQSITRQQYDIKYLTLSQHEVGYWKAEYEVSTQGLIDLVAPIASKKRPEIIDEEKFTVVDATGVAISNPDNTIPTTLGNPDIAIHFRYDSSVRDFKLELHAGDTATAAMVISWRGIITSTTDQTIAKDESDASLSGEGKGIILVENGGQRNIVESGNGSGAHVGWTIGNAAGGTLDRAILTWPASPTVVKGDFEFYFHTTDSPTFRTITFGDTVLAAGISFGKPILVRGLDLQP